MGDASQSLDADESDGQDDDAETSEDVGADGTDDVGEEDGDAGDGDADDAGEPDGDPDAGDAEVEVMLFPPIERCPDQDLGTMMGDRIAAGSTEGAEHLSQGSCGGPGGIETSFKWTAPRTGEFTFDTQGSTYDTLLYIRDASYPMCTGPEVPTRRGRSACNDDSGPDVDAWLAVPAEEGDEFIIFVEGQNSTRRGDFWLNITEWVPEDCDTEDDEDRDGEGQCGDSDCRRHPGCYEENCTDGLDDDGGGDIDCDDIDCRRNPFCAEASCDDGEDEDEDGFTDCADSECRCDLACGPDPCESETIDYDVVLGEPLSGRTVPGCSPRGATTCGGGEAPEAYVRFMAPSSGTYRFDTTGTSFDTVLSSITECGSREIIACDGDGGDSFTSAFELELDAGESVIIVVDGWDRLHTGPWQLVVTST